jgi:tRNA dimethylallyltransferase
MRPKLVVIFGPTASGKSELALKLAKKFNGEIINADSRSVYRGFDIGTAKPSKREMKIVPHHLFDIIDANKEFGLGEYKKLADKKIADIWKRGRLPFLVGGTGLYIQAVIENWQIPSRRSNQALRDELESMSLHDLLHELNEVDYKTFQVIDKQNKRRVVRALEVYFTTGESFVAQKKKAEPLYDCLILSLSVPRKKLYKNIDERVDKMLKDGLEKEVLELSKKYSWSKYAMSGIGYRQWRPYFDGKCTRDTVIERIKFDNHAYARRQLTWLRKMKGIILVKNLKEAHKLVSEFLDV